MLTQTHGDVYSPTKFNRKTRLSIIIGFQQSLAIILSIINQIYSALMTMSYLPKLSNDLLLEIMNHHIHRQRVIHVSGRVISPTPEQHNPESQESLITGFDIMPAQGACYTQINSFLRTYVHAKCKAANQNLAEFLLSANEDNILYLSNADRFGKVLCHYESGWPNNIKIKIPFDSRIAIAIPTSDTIWEYVGEIMHAFPQCKTTYALLNAQPLQKQLPEDFVLGIQILLTETEKTLFSSQTEYILEWQRLRCQLRSAEILQRQLPGCTVARWKGLRGTNAVQD